jgi:hypothetical protein
MTEGVQTAIPAKTDDDYNTIFEKLVDECPSQEGMQGFIAYVFYKIAKREWILKQQRDTGKKPNDVELRAYIRTWTESRVQSLRVEADQALASFASYIIARERPKILREALSHRSFWRESFVACFGAFLWTIILILLAFMLKFNHIDLVTVLRNVGVEGH